MQCGVGVPGVSPPPHPGTGGGAGAKIWREGGVGAFPGLPLPPLGGGRQGWEHIHRFTLASSCDTQHLSGAGV